MRRRFLLALVLVGALAAAGAPVPLAAQEPAAAAHGAAQGPVQEILLRDGSRIFGRVVSQDAERLVW